MASIRKNSRNFQHCSWQKMRTRDHVLAGRISYSLLKGGENTSSPASCPVTSARRV